eukprot:TRINITY_DN8680_c0_g1_i1.p1 TRINITY_DN8680_c0_g1~~TRINITY_DN8680_c0_g1_i1.p1  ORF type:complete len:505 (+),score=91.76 TRINITY_DN8680_c0_g1_i1:49-1563(+)
MAEPPAVGTKVEIQGLKSRGDLNGKQGWVTAYDADADRVEVSFDGASNQKIKVKLVNAIAVKDLQSANDGLAVGVCVQIMGLQSRADLNGRRASIVARDDVAGRIEVQLDGLTGNERIKVKPSCLKIAKDGVAVGVQVEILGLQSRSDLNGRCGIIVAREVAVDLVGNDRIEVHLDGPNGGERIKCKPTNVKVVSKKVDLSSAVEIAAAAARLKAQGRNRGSNEGADRHDRDQESEQARSRDQDYAGDRDSNRDRERRRDRSRSRQRPGAASFRSDTRGGGGRSGTDPKFSAMVNGTVEDRSNDWVCSCGERNFARRNECHKCHTPRATDAPSYKGVSHMLEKMLSQQRQNRPPRPGGPLGEWTSAKDLLRKSDLDELRQKIDERSLRRKHKEQQQRQQRQQRQRSSSSSSSTSSESSSKAKRKASPEQPEAAPVQVSSELDKLKDEALQKLLKIRDEPPDVRKKSWKQLLFEWHPDKHPDNKDDATAVFQFLQKGKALLDLKG